eukprot:TRINITY_DN5777_c2_g1_i1.p1 TRINITY_DN5777_c2_g1~~TRINITY_DN5777_c2_g1_i1.p1  ORF type:complete len:260 (-),score=59.96 TRINITY_DN5777_c2_g1_i1:208-987(-)
MAVSGDENPLTLSIVFSTGKPPVELSLNSNSTGLDLKNKIRDQFEIADDKLMALMFQNGSRNSSKLVVEEDQALSAQGVEDGATISVKVNAVEVRPKDSALRQSISDNGTSSYYYAHANEKALPAELRYVYGGAPIKMDTVGGEDTDATKVEVPAVAITKYSWADEGDFVCIYVSAESESEAIEAAADGKGGQVKADFGPRTVELKIAGATREFALILRELEGEIVPEESKHRVSAGKRVTLKLKKKRQGLWTRLVRPR